MKILYPIELLLSGVFSFSYNLTGHYGYALILMSVCITLITTPIYLVADYWKNQEKKKAAEIYAELDTGKIRALAYGGWSLKDIAEEVGCSTDVAAEVIKGWINGR